MFHWWPRILPYIGLGWVASDRYGEIVDHDSEWVVRVFLIAWLSYALIIFQIGLPQRCN